MKKCFQVLILIIIFGSTSLQSDGQDQKTTSLRSPQRAAEGQSKWMMNNMKFDPHLYESVYSINLKYQIRADSIHALKDVSYDEKKRLYASALKSKKEEFKQTFSRDAYNQYVTLLESVRQNAPPK